MGAVGPMMQSIVSKTFNSCTDPIRCSSRACWYSSLVIEADWVSTRAVSSPK
jgi:hypothetical protein